MSLPFSHLAVVTAVLVLPGLDLRHARAADAARSPENAAIQRAEAMYEGVRTETLPNGLRIYLRPIPNAPVVTTMVAYKVGSSDENLDHTGLSHYLEHLMFKGTEKLRPGDIDRMTLRNGGQNNAYTSEDYTIYHFDFAADRWEQVLDIEADRMRNLRIDTAHEFEQEKGAVIEELQRDEDEPWDLEQKAIVPLLFGSGPYGHPVIGERQHVRGATAAVIKAHYDRWYYPNNASLVIVGGFDPERTLAKVREKFGPLPRGELPERRKAEPMERKGPVSREIASKFTVARMLMGYNTVRIGEPDYYVLEVIDALLTGGKTGRLYKNLVEGAEIASSVGSGDQAGRYPGWFEVRVQVLPGKDRKRAERLVLDELERLRGQPVAPAELERAKRGILASIIFSREGVHEFADSIARGVTTNDLEYLKTYLPRVAAVTAEDVQRVARKYFDPDRRVVVWSVPPAGAGAREEVTPSQAPRRSAQRDDSAGAGHGFSLHDTRRVVLDNGLTLLLFENHQMPIVVADAHVGHERLLEPADHAGVAALMGSLLSEGTRHHTGPQIAELIENVGGTLGMSASGGSVKVLSPNRKLGLGLLFECLTEPTFPAKAFARDQKRQLAALDDVERQPEAKALLTYRSLVYGKHPFGRSSLGRRETVAALKPEDCAAFHRKAFVPNNTVVAVVGDFHSDEVIAEIKELTASWTKQPLDVPAAPAVERPREFTEKVLTMREAVQLHFYMGHVGVRRDNPDYYKLLVMDYILGTGPGFTDRLSARLRDRMGLAYTVTANITASASTEPGAFTCYIGTEPGNLKLVKGLFLEELNRIRSEPPAEAEVAAAKQYLIGHMPFEFTTNGAIAGQLLTVERYHLGLDYLEDFRKAVEAVQPGEVQAVAHKYIDPAHMVLVVAGAVDAQGRSLKKDVREPAGN